MNLFSSSKKQIQEFENIPSTSSHLNVLTSYRTHPIYPILPLHAQATSVSYASPPDLLCVTYSTPTVPLIQIISTNGPIISTFPIPGASARGSKTGIRGSWIVGKYVIVLDEKETIWGWNLSEMAPGNKTPKRAWTRSLRGRCTMVTPCPSLKHIFIGYQDGTVETFHLDRGTISEYSISNLWARVDTISQMTASHKKRRVPPITDIKISPVDLNRVLVAYDGGIVLFSLKGKQPINYYELIIPPGAKGGSNSMGEQLFTERRPTVMCLSWRYDGEFFVVGYSDGSIAFWAADEPDKPLSVRTLGEEDVNLVDPEGMFDEPEDIGMGNAGEREPVFKLSWCHATDKDGMYVDCVLVLGGTTKAEQKGIWCLSFPLKRKPTSDQPTEAAPSSPTSVSAKQARFTAFKSLIHPAKTSCPFPASLSSPHVIPYEYQLISANPHYEGSFSPTSIVIITADARSDELERSVIAYAVDIPTIVGNAWAKDPKKLEIPMCLEWLGDGALVQVKMYDVPKQTVYQRMTAQKWIPGIHASEPLILRGGKATEVLRSEDRGYKAFLEGAKEIMVSWHVDGKIRFYDVSPHLLQDPYGALKGVHTDIIEERSPSFIGRVKEQFPKSLAHLTIDLDSKDLKEIVGKDEWIVDVQLAKETWDCAVLLKGGKVVLFRLGQGSANKARQSAGIGSELSVDEISTSLADAIKEMKASESTSSSALSPGPIETQPSSSASPKPSKISGFLHKKPAPMTENLSAGNRQVEYRDLRHDSYHFLSSGVLPLGYISCESKRVDGKVCLSDMGFVAGWGECGLWILDLRDGDWIWRDSEQTTHVAKEKEKSKKEVWGEVVCMKWTVCELSTDQVVTPRLLVAYACGFVRILTLSYSLSTWTVNIHHTTSVWVKSNPQALYVLDHHSFELRGTPETLEVTLVYMEDPTLVRPRDDPTKSYLYGISKDGTIEVFSGVNGPRVLKKSTEEPIATSAYLHQSGGSALVLVRQTGWIFSYSLPQLEEDNRVGILTPSSEMSLETLTITPSLGDFIYPTPGGATEIYTLFDFNRPSFPPSLALVDGQLTIPTRPSKGNVLMGQVEAWSNWWAGKDEDTSVSDGRVIDELLGGPEPDPPPTASTSRQKTTPSGSKQGRVEEEYDDGANMPTVFQRAQQALEERDIRLGAVQETLDEIGKGATNMVKEAKRVAAQQALKQGIAGWISKNL